MGQKPNRQGTDLNLLAETVQLVDLGLGNTNSIRNSLLRSGIKTDLLRPGKLPRNRVLILPGVGSFDSGVQALDSKNFRQVIVDHVSDGGALIGICLGMQLLGKSSEEGVGDGLGIIGFETKLIAKNGGKSAPIMGWKTPKISRPGWLDLDTNQRYYFMHDYGVHETANDHVTMIHEVSDTPVASAVAAGKVIGFQFHPERSLKYGQEILAKAVEELSR